MKRIFLMLACLLAFVASAFATEERIAMPQDQGTWYLTIFGGDGQLQTWLETNPGLMSLKSQVRFNEYTPNQVRYQRYAKDMPGLPCIRLQNEKGLVVSEWWGNNIPPASNALYKGIKADLQDKTSWGRLRRKRCPTPTQPEPPKPPVVVPFEPPVGPPVGPPVLDDEPEPEPKESRLWIILAVLSGLGGGAFGLFQGYKSENMKPSPKSSKL